MHTASILIQCAQKYLLHIRFCFLPLFYPCDFAWRFIQAHPPLTNENIQNEKKEQIALDINLSCHFATLYCFMKCVYFVINLRCPNTFHSDSFFFVLQFEWWRLVLLIFSAPCFYKDKRKNTILAFFPPVFEPEKKKYFSFFHFAIIIIKWASTWIKMNFALKLSQMLENFLECEAWR